MNFVAMNRPSDREKVARAIASMDEANADTATLSLFSGSELVLVRGNTAAAAEAVKKASVLQPLEFDGKQYLLCRE